MYFSFKIKGAGKTSALNLVKKQLEENNYDVLTVPEVKFSLKFKAATIIFGNGVSFQKFSEIEKYNSIVQIIKLQMSLEETFISKFTSLKSKRLR
jgi:hypothetical protein